MTAATARESVPFFVTRCAEKLRKARLAASVVTVFIQTGRFSEGPQYANSVTLEMVYPSDSTKGLLRHAVEALQRIYREGYEFRKAGVMLSGLVPAEQTTGRLFDDEALERFRRLMPVVDLLNQKVRPGHSLIKSSHQAAPNVRRQRRARILPSRTQRQKSQPDWSGSRLRKSW